MKKIRILCGLIGFMSIFHANAYATELIDIDTHWAKNEIVEAVCDGIVSGYEDYTFRPNQLVTLPEFLKMLILSSPYYMTMANGVLYPDSYLATGKSRGLVLEGEFENPNQVLTREEVARILARFEPLENVTGSFHKLKDLKEENQKDILKLVKLGIIYGYEDQTFRGENPVTRAEALVMIQRAMTARKQLSLEKQYCLEESKEYTNYYGHEKIGTMLDDVSYEIQNGKLLVSDEGRYFKKNHEEIKSEIVDMKNVTKVIQNLVNDLSYVGVYYVPSQELYDQLVIAYGQNEKRVSNNTNEFYWIYYPEEYYPLQEYSRVDLFSNQCYMKISITKLWLSLNEFQKKNYVDDFLKAKLTNALEGEFGKGYAVQIMAYIEEKINETFLKADNYDTEIGQKIFGRYQVDYYKRENGLPEFYFSIRY